jgi:hypothetical protein
MVRRHRRCWLAAGALAATLLAGCDSDGDSDVAGGDVTTTSSPPETTTTTGPPTTTAASSTAEVSTPASTSAAATSTTAAVTSTTPASPTPAQPTGGVVLEPDGMGVIGFGRSDADTITALTQALGAPTAETAWGPSFSGFGTCPGTEVKGVSWGSFTVLLGDDSPFASGVRHAYTWFVGGGAPDEADLGLRTAAGIGVGSTVTEIRAAYGSNVTFTSADEQPELGLATFDVGEYPDVIFGTLTGSADDDTVTYLEGGAVCGE